MNTQAALAEGSRLMLRIPLSATDQVVVEAEVVYVNEERGVGVRFRNLSDDARHLLETTLMNG